MSFYCYPVVTLFVKFDAFLTCNIPDLLALIINAHKIPDAKNHLIMKIFLLLSVLTWIELTSAHAQVNYVATHIGNNEGLSNSCINTVYQDSNDLMWLGTWDGLNLYNGTSIHVFNYGNKAGQNFLANNVIINIAEDLKKNIWAGTVEGVSRIDKQTGQLTNFFYDRQRVSSNGFILSVNEVGEIFAARCNQSTIYNFNERTQRFQSCYVDGLKGMITDFKVDKNGLLWVLKNPSEIELYRPERGKFRRGKGINIKNVLKIFKCNGQIFFTTTKKELYCADDTNEQPIKLLDLAHEARAMTFYQNHYIFAWASKGLGEYTKDFQPVSTIAEDNPELKGVRITSLFPGKESILWLGTDGKGIIKISRKPNYFGAFLKQPNGDPFAIPVRAFNIIDHELWVGTKGNGIITITNWDKPNRKFSGMKSFNAGEDLLNNCVYSVVNGPGGNIYIGSDAPGITIYDRQSRQFVQWKDIIGGNHYLSFNSVHCILQDKDGSLWLGLNSNGLIHVKIGRNEKNQFFIEYLKNYVYKEDNSGPANNVIYSLAADSNDHIWIGCRYGGLSLFNKKTEKFRNFKTLSYNGSLSNNDILSLYIDRRQTLWIGTSFGLNWVNERQATESNYPYFHKINSDNGLPNNTIHSITQDNQDKIWISTNKGIARIDPANMRIVNFKESDGLQNDEFSDNAVWKNQSGKIFFGGIAGFNYFQPEMIQITSTQPQLMLSDLQLAGQKMNTNIIRVLNSGLKSATSHYELAPQDNYFEQKVEFINYVNPQKCQYRFMLIGNDHSWHVATHAPTIFYNNLSPGDYTLRIKWSNGELGWTRPVTAYTITVKQYFWLTPVAFTFYIIVSLGSLFLYYRYRKNKFLLNQKFILEHKLREKDEKLHQEQLRFFTNIAHELQTPLTLILSALERYWYKKQQQESEIGSRFLSIVKHEAVRLHYLIHQLLEFRKAESGQLRNHYGFLNVSHMFEHIAGLFSAMAEQRNLDFSIHVDTDINLWTDKDKIEKIAFNLLSNAFKHSGDNQYIIFSVQVIKSRDILEIVIANSGCHLTQNEIDHIFDMYYTVADNQQTKISSGIGLAFTRELVNKLNGNIAVTRDKDWITFKITLPLSFEPTPVQKNYIEKDQFEKLSYIFTSLVDSQKQWMTPAIADNNKKSLMQSFEDEQRKAILIVEDDQLIRYILRDILSEQHIIYEASSGREALETISRLVPDLIISDIMMPDMDGLELCRIIKDTPASCHIPLILLTARDTIEQKIEGYECGADAYIAKPFQTEHLQVRVRKLLEYRDKLHKYFRAVDSSYLYQNAPGIKDADQKFLETLVGLIETHITEELDSSFLEKKMNVSRMQLYRKIKTLSDMTPSELIRQVRLKKAALLLSNSDLTVSEIFYQTGFNNKTYFFREFRKIYKASPNEYRLIYRVPAAKKML
jgi:signal transduction histidine kinase/DNA-binding response OmpR family regulator/ligand-binding sensor domain-containing protein